MKMVRNISVIAALCALMFAMTGCLGSDKFAQEVEKEKGAVKLLKEVQRGGYDIITTPELKALLDKNKDVIVIDTMPYEASYKKEHVPGAKQFLFPIPDMVEWDVKETDGKTKEQFIEMLGPDKDAPIVIYCGFVKCTRSHNGAAWAKKLGYTNVKRYPGGIFAWKGAKYPVGSVK
ncbi:rhodanese-like domain-containing protein [Desulfovibrio sp. JC010]|uniref:rhodanese-like domain-containing protein n=1 Tax=Desulfovibrio sp. JC010 TaxID=2593641 RepID=UPI0013D51AC3|nr:rhodanese-like domain-containing protein [Desulfovibrio sp. JC010]NDV28405.1 rhodanese-like domain-containing protein [Desulfovibrio sp. JC010]